MIQGSENLLRCLVDHCDRELGLRFKKMIKTALLDASQFADLIHAGAAIRAQPNEVVHGFDQSLFGIARASHAWMIAQLDDRSTIFFQVFCKFASSEKLFFDRQS